MIRKKLLIPSAGVLALVLAACSTPPPPVVQTPAVAITAQDLVGKWGLAAYRADSDLVRTTAEAKRACSNPYVVSPGSNGGVMMHLADQPAASEVYLKPASDGGVYIGPQGKPAEAHDRQVLSYGNGVLVMRWVSADANTRYGTMVYVRCAA